MERLSCDVVVLGGGTAGCVVAGRLAAESDAEVVVLEAGPDYGPCDSGDWPADLLDGGALVASHSWGYDTGNLHPLRGPVERVLGEVVAVKGRTRVGRCQRGERDPGTTPDIGDERAPLELDGHAVERGHDARHQRETRPRPQHAFGAMRTGRAQPVVRETDARAERAGQLADHLRVERCGERAGGEREAVIFSRQHFGAGGCERERRPVGALQQLGRRVAAQPFQQPAGIEACAQREVVGRERAGAVERPVQPQTVAEVHEQRHHLALLVAPHPEREERHVVRVDVCCAFVQCGRSPTTLTRRP